MLYRARDWKRGADKPLLLMDALLGSDGLMIVGVSAGRLMIQHLALGDFTDEHHVAAQILLLNDLAEEYVDISDSGAPIVETGLLPSDIRNSNHSDLPKTSAIFCVFCKHGTC